MLDYLTGGLVGGLAQTAFQHVLNKDSTNYNMQKQYEYSKRLFDYQNDYNSPANQVKRLREAGLSPWLMNGNSQVASMPSAPTPQSNAPDVGSAISSFSNLIAQSESAHQTRLQNKVTENSLDYLIEQNKKMAEKLGLDVAFDSKTFDTRVEGVARGVDLTGAQLDRAKQDLMYYSQQYPKLLRSLDKEYEKLCKEYDITEQDLLIRQNDKKISDFEKDIKEISANLCKKFGVTPDADGIKAIIQCILNGKGDVLLKTLASGLLNTAKEGAKSLFDYLF